MKKKAWLSALAVVLVLCCAVGGTLAWLTQKTDAVVNTFTVGDINITLTETEREYKMVPGNTIDKDPTVTVQAGSEACWLFVKVEESNWPDFKEADGTTRKVSYSVNNGWNVLKNTPGVYFREVSAEEAQKGIDYTVLAGNENCPSGVIKVSQELTKAEINSIRSSEKQPSLTFTAYAVQRAGIDTAAAAWATVNS